MHQKIKQLLCYVVIIILLPYVITVFINGPSIVSSSHVDEAHVKVKADSGEIKVPVEEYCIGILAKEIPVFYEDEALRAQAILVRTDVYSKMGAQGSGAVLEGEFLSRKQMEEMWGTSHYAANYERLEDAWRSTKGQVVTYDEKLAKTPFFRLSNGSTRDGMEALGSEEYPYLKIVDCPLDIEASEQIQTRTVEDMDVEVAAVDTAGYVLSVRVGEETVSGEEFRNNYHLVSSCFTFQKYDGKLRITTRGIGHGLGMSQHTANEMAKAGQDAASILQYFFAGTQLKEVAEIVAVSE